MIRSFARTVAIGAAACAMALGAQVASATVFTFDFQNAAKSKSAGGVVTTSSNEDAAFTVQVSAFQYANNALNYASAVEYSGAGLGVLGAGESTSNGSHQIDNNSGLDLVELKFSQAVTLTDIARKNFNYEYRNPVTGSGLDASYAVGSLGSVGPADFVQIAGTSTGATKSSQVWLVGANIFQTDDSFKITSLKVLTPNSPGAVPEPATWAMMIVGIGAIGSTLRRRRSQGLSGSIA